MNINIDKHTHEHSSFLLELEQKAYLTDASKPFTMLVSRRYHGESSKYEANLPSQFDYWEPLVLTPGNRSVQIMEQVENNIIDYINRGNPLEGKFRVFVYMNGLKILAFPVTITGTTGSISVFLGWCDRRVPDYWQNHCGDYYIAEL